ncbi:MAG TPA: hypothetical protein VJS30_31190 [Paraburkholderia sp.]|nr:hypothetical protein [Paraburkholderia sp.]
MQSSIRKGDKLEHGGEIAGDSPVRKSFGQLCAAAVVFLPVVAHCGISEEVYCFDSGGAGSKNFGIHILYDDAAKWSGAFVKYHGTKSTVRLVLKSEESEEISQGRPDQVTTAWYEVYGEEIARESMK